MISGHHQSKTDKELAHCAAKNDLSAFEELVCRYEKRVFLFLYQKLPNRETAEELTQDTFLKAHRYIDKYDARYQFTTWIYTIAKRLAASYYRENSRIKLCPYIKTQEDSYQSAEDLIIKQEDNASLWAVARENLSSPQYTALYLRYVEEMSVKDIAHVLEKSVTHTKVLLYRARNIMGGVIKNKSRDFKPAQKAENAAGSRLIHKQKTTYSTHKAEDDNNEMQALSMVNQ